MTCSTKHIMPPGNRKISSFFKSMILLCLAVLFFQHEALFAQVISNTGAAISVTNGAVIDSKDFENTDGSLGNNGAINLSGNYFNAGPGITNGNGLYNIKGNWTNYGLFNAGTSIVTFDGFSNQTIMHGSSGETFYILTINNPGWSVTQVANAGSTLAVLNNLNITAGTLSLGSTTLNLTVGGKATIHGGLKFNDLTTQTASIADNLSGSGKIDMSGGSFPHLLNLTGATNAIGTFTTSPSGSSTVDYKGTDQTVFPTANYRNLTISNSGIKTLQGNSTVGKNLNISGGTFDLGTTTTTLGVGGATTIAGSLRFNGISTKTVSLTGNLSGAGSIDMSGSILLHLLKLNGSTNSIGSYTSLGSESTVDYIHNGDQSVFTSNNYRNLKISGSGVKTLNSDISASGILTMLSGNINSNGNTLKITNSSIGAIIRTAGTVIGKLQRAIDIQGSDYLYPIGSATNYNPLKLKFQNLTSGPLTAQFKVADIGNAGLPLDDDGNEVWDRFTEGYWNLTAVPPMASNSYNVKLNYDGFSGVDSSSRIIKRTDGGPLELDGNNGLFTTTELERDTLEGGISTNSIDFAIGKGHPKIKEHPVNINICEGSDAFFEVKAKGHSKHLTYQWQVDDGSGSGFTNIVNGGVYSEATTRKLILTAADYGMNGYLYRVIVTDKAGNSNNSNSALLTVNKIPIATATPSQQDICQGVAFTDIVLGTDNNVTGTTFNWNRNNPAGITSSVPLSGINLVIGDVISGSFVNSTDSPITVTFTFVPTGPLTTFCTGNPITATVTVNPTPRIFPVPLSSIQCDSSTTAIKLQSPSVFTFGDVTFKYTVVATGGVAGFNTPVSGLPNNHVINDFLVNPTTSVHTVKYTLTPVSPLGCADGSSKEFTITVNPTPRINAVLSGNTVVCDTATIDFSFTTGNPSIEGERYYYLESSYTGDVSGVQKTDYYPINTDIADILINNTKHYQTVKYKIKPVFQNVGGIDLFDCERGIDTTITIYLNPTPVFDSIIVSDTMICNESFVSFDFYNTQVTTGTIVYEYIGTYSAGDLSGVKPDGQFGLDSFTDKIINSSELIQPVTYLFKPIINDPVNGLYCNKGINTSRLVKVTPTLLSTAKPHTFIGGKNIRCFGENNGAINISPRGGYYLDDYFYTWTKNGLPISIPTVEDPSGLTAGSYKYRVEDKIGCYFIDSVNLTQPKLLLIATDSFKTVSCEGKRDGKIYISVSGGTPAYKYKWEDDDGIIWPNEDLIGDVRYGGHFLTINDTNNCKFDTTYTLIPPKLMQITFTPSYFGKYNISCNGESDGKIITTADGNGPPEKYKYNWLSYKNGSLPDTIPDLSGLVSATYSLTVVDTMQCQESSQITLTEPDPITITRTGQKHAANFDISCFGLSDGIINIRVDGGHTSYLPIFYDGTDSLGFSTTTRDINGLHAGTYYFNIRDTYCQKDTFFTLIEPTEMILDTVFIRDYNGYQVSCKNSRNSFLDLSLNGGYSGYNYTWSTANGLITNPNTLDQTGIPAGHYLLDVVDSINCPAQWGFEITEPDTISVTPLLHENNEFEISCFGGADGTIDLNTGGGKTPYVFAWSSSDGSGLSSLTENQDSLTHGTYSVNVTDKNNCQASWNYKLEQPDKLITRIDSTTTISCFNTNDGAAYLTVSGGVTNYIYSWSNGENTEDIVSLFTGKYYVDIIDANNCPIRDSTFVSEPPEIIINLDVPLQFNGRMVSCFGKSDAIVNSHVEGGVGAYHYNWSPNGEQTTGISKVRAGLYRLTITDDNLCTKENSILVEQPLKLKTEVYETNPTCFGKADGQITLIVQGGTPEYSIIWKSISQQGQTADSIGVGIYDVVITDINQCRIDTVGILIQPQLITLKKEIKNPTCPDIFDGHIQYQIDGGTPPYDLLLNNQRVDELITDLRNGSYSLKITDNNQCILMDTSVLKGASPMCITAPNAFSPDGDGINDTWVIDQIEIYPDVKVEVYNRWGELIYYAPKGYTKPWDGTYKGREIPIDSYYYVIDLNNGRNVLTGNITIIR